MQIIIDIKQILRQAKQSAYRNINKAMLEAYWLVGKRIVEEEQQGESRAAYGKAVIENLSGQSHRDRGCQDRAYCSRPSLHERSL